MRGSSGEFAERGELEYNLHQLFKRKLLPPVFRAVMGEEVSKPRSTTKLNKSGFSDYLDKICALTNVPYCRTLKQRGHPQQQANEALSSP